jgi:hypothetical protein
VDENIKNSMIITELTEKEYYDFLKSVDRILTDEYCSFSSCCGPHTFTIEVLKNGIRYTANWGWGWNDNDKSKRNYYITTLYKEQGQEGDGI